MKTGGNWSGFAETFANSELFLSLSPSPLGLLHPSFFTETASVGRWLDSSGSLQGSNGGKAEKGKSLFLGKREQPGTLVAVASPIARGGLNFQIFCF